MSSLLIISDVEGVTGIIDNRLMSKGNPFWKEYGRHLLTEDINVVNDSFLDTEYFDSSFLSESHNLGKNTVYKKLSKSIKVLPPHSAQTSFHGRSFWDNFYSKTDVKAAVMVGFHAMEGKNGFAPHSWDAGVFKSIKVNDKEYGEIGLTALLLGCFDIPLICVTGDREAVYEAESLLPGLIGISVKEQMADGSVRLKPFHSVKEEMENSIKGNCKSALEKIKPLKIDGPVTIEIELKHEAYLESYRTFEGIEIKDNKVYIKADDYQSAYDLFWQGYFKVMLYGAPGITEHIFKGLLYKEKILKGWAYR